MSDPVGEGHNSFYSEKQLSSLGLKCYGSNVLISSKACIYKPDQISLGSYVRIDDFTLLSGGSGISIGNFVHIGAYSALYGGGGILMEDFSGLAPRCTVLSEMDDFLGKSLTGPTIPRKYKPSYKSAIIVFRQHSGLGVNSTILPGVELGEGSGSGAHTLITKDCEPWMMYIGNPINRVIRRSKNILKLKHQFLEELGEI
jgi:galactoside O-acetyltransferase